MAGLGEPEGQVFPAASEHGRRASVQSSTLPASGMSVGLKKRRPASPEVVITARPRTPSSNGNTSFEQSQSPTKKQRTESAIQLDIRPGDASVFTTRYAEGAIDGRPKTPSKAINAPEGPIDAGLIVTTETFSHLSTVTPKDSHPEGVRVPSEAASAGRSSKPASPSSRRQSNVVVEIPQSRPGSAHSHRNSPSRVAERATIRTSRPSSPVSKPEQERSLPGIHFLQAADDTLSSHAPSPELEEVPPVKARSRKRSPQPAELESNLPLHPRRSPTPSSSSSFLAEAAMLRSKSREPDPEASSSSAPSNPSPHQSRAVVDNSSLARMFNSPSDPWFAKPSRHAAATKKSYAEDSADDTDEEEDEPYVTNSANKLLGKGSKAAPNGSRKGKERAMEDKDASPSEQIEQAKVAKPTNSRTPAKGDKKLNERGNSSVSKKKAALTKSKSESHLTGKGKAKGRRKGSMSSGSSDLEDFFNLKSPSPMKKKKTTVRKKTTPAKKGAPSQSVKTSLLSTKPISGDTSDDDLPTLPFSSQPPPQSQVTSTFDLLDIDDIAFVAVPAVRKAEAEGSPRPYYRLLHFWWPARIVNRNKKNFTVSLIFGDLDKAPECFTEDAFVIAESDLDGNHVQKLSSRCNPFPTFAEAFEAILGRSDAGSYALPSGSAYTSALSNALRREKDHASVAIAADAIAALPSPEEESEGLSTASELDLLKRSRPEFSSDTEDDEEEIQVGTVGLGKNRNVWWPCRIMTDNSQNGKGNQSANPKDRRRPYRVEFYPKSTASLSRKDIMLKSDPDFFTVPLGEIQTSEISPLIPHATLREILPEMAQIASGEYAADRKRHAYFVDGSATEKNYLSRMAVYGQFPRKQVDQLSDFLLDWAFGRSKEAVSIPASAPFHTFGSDEQKSNYVALVLLPIALELLVIKDDLEIDQKAIKRLKEAGKPEPTNDELRMMAHSVAAEELEASSEWWDSILTLRSAHQAGKFVNEEMRTELDDEDLAAMGMATRRRKVNVNYKE